MNSLGAPALWLSLISSAGTFPFLLFTVPAGALADLSPEANARFQLLAGLQRRLTALLSFLHRLTPRSSLRTRYVPNQVRLLIYFSMGTIIVFGPKALEFYDDFFNHRATNLKPDGMEILSVEMDLNRPDPA